MKEIETGYIKKVIDIMKNNELTEVVLEDEDKMLTIRTDYTPVIKEKESGEVISIPTDIETEQKEEEPKKNIVPIISNMIGLFYSRPEPNGEAFVKVGERVEEGQVVCLIETIKFMNKITSLISGKVTEICIEDGKPVEYGQVIMYVEED